MSKVKEDPDREERILMEVVVDAYDAEERAMGWYYYLAETITFPFISKCTLKRATSPLKVGDEINVIAMAPADECEREIYVMVPWDGEELAVPLAQLKVVHAEDEESRIAVEDWHYWMKRGYQF